MTTPATTMTEWTRGAVATVVFAVQRAPSVHNTRPALPSPRMPLSELIR